MILGFFGISSHIPFLISILLAFSIFSRTAAFSNEAPFSNISFQDFNHFINHNFHANITLASVLCILFSMTENPELLNLHARQQNAQFKGERSIAVTGWIKCLAWSLFVKIPVGEDLLRESDVGCDVIDDAKSTNLGIKLDAFAKLLQLNPCNQDSKVKRKLKPISYKRIEGVCLICPDVYECLTASCKPWGLQQNSRPRDIPLVTLIKGFQISEDVSVLTGKCTKCETTYYADHEHAPSEDDPS